MTVIKFRTTVDGKRKNFTYPTLQATAAAWGVSYGCFVMRLHDGWSVRKAATTPQRAWDRKKA